jgi:ribosomal protein L11 methyltransferase
MFYSAKFQVIDSIEDWWDIVVAFIQDLPYSSYILDDENSKVAHAYTNELQMELSELENATKEVIEQLPFSVEFSLQAVEKSNWNKEWESNFQPVTIEKRLRIYANFHPKESGFENSICITPRMSFGTGHHETTHLMCEYVLDNDVKGKRVMDAGCGSGILAILAKMQNADFVEAFDIEDWSVQNTKDNAAENGVNLESVFTGTICDSKTDDYDVILANINRNILLKTMAEMASKIVVGGHLVLSGFYATDIEALVAKGVECNMKCIEQKERNTWNRLVLEKL